MTHYKDNSRSDKRPPTLEEYSRAQRAKGDFPLKREVTAKDYSIEMPMDDFCALSSYENELTWDETVADMLDKQTNAVDIDYNGHFGSYIYLTLETDYDTPEAWADIERIITDQIERAKQWQTTQNS